MNNGEIPFLSATELSRMIQGKDVSPVEVTEAYLERIDCLDFKFNSYLTVCRRQALEQARAAESAIAAGEYRGPMHGIPVAVKDQIWTRGIRTTNGSRVLADFFPEEDATIVGKLKAAGAVILGKTNLTEFAGGGGIERFSPPRNPWNLDMRTGGSSGGSGAATAAFLCATSLGEDTGGSIRSPAAWCGLVGLRPTWGRVSRHGMFRGIWSMDTAGPISRTVEDAAITLAAIAGHDPQDPYSWNAPVPDYRVALDGSVRGLRVGLITEHLRNPMTEPDTRDAVVKAASVLEGLGAAVEEVSLPLSRHAALVATVPLMVEPAQNYQHWVRDRLSDFGHNNRIRLLTGSIIPAQVYYKVQRLRSLLREEVRQALEKYDLLMTPSAGTTAARIQDDPIISSKGSALTQPSLYGRIFNLTGTPAISIPCGFDSRGLPIGLQIGGRLDGATTVLKLAHASEQSTPWHTIRPPHA